MPLYIVKYNSKMLPNGGNMADGIDINVFTGKAKEIAIKIDNSNVKDGKIADNEISIFLHECKENNIAVEQESWYSKCADIFNQHAEALRKKISSFIPEKEQHVEVPDATYVAPPAEAIAQNIGGTEEQAKKIKEPAKIAAGTNIRTDYDWSEEEFSEVMNQMLNAPKYKGKFSKSVLQGKAQAFIEAGKKYHIDPRVLVAIAMCESARGTSTKAIKYNNIGGLRNGNGYIHFDTVEESIDSIARTVNTRYTEGYTTPKEIAYSGRYCAKSAASGWLSQVNSYLSTFNKYYNKGL